MILKFKVLIISFLSLFFVTKFQAERRKKRLISKPKKLGFLNTLNFFDFFLKKTRVVRGITICNLYIFSILRGNWLVSNQWISWKIGQVGWMLLQITNIIICRWRCWGEITPNRNIFFVPQKKMHANRFITLPQRKRKSI